MLYKRRTAPSMLREQMVVRSDPPRDKFGARGPPGAFELEGDVVSATGRSGQDREKGLTVEMNFRKESGRVA